MKKYEAALKDLENKIKSGYYKTNDLLPSESDFCDEYKISRSTIRQALSILENEGLIQKQQGRGSVVIFHNKLLLPVSDLISYKEMQKSLKLNDKTDVITFEVISIDRNLSNLTMFPLDSQAFLILRKRYIDGKVLILDKDIIRCDIAPFLSSEIAKDSIYNYLENVLDLEIAYAQKEITIDLVHDSDKKYLDLHPLDRHVVSVKSHVFLKDNTLFQYSESRHQVDQFKISEFARRHKI
ncbi:MAG: trehalose operon repressor [Streptococcaceae bacterium]|jgi:GntR family trehalose operon transcriptional repressor|nr:trehalose operon repressor [Streptococcaceae bacterium]